MKSNLAIPDTESKMENPLVWSIFEILQKQNEGWKVHTLAAYLRQQGLMPELDILPDKDLFKRNFLIMNALYQLQEELHPESYIQVQAMDIKLVNTDINRVDAITHSDPLRDYYTDWVNYEAESGEVKRLLNEFWSRYRRYLGGSSANMSREDALRLFNLRADATPHEMRKRWRALALKWHPDREGGNAEKFRQYCEAWSVLRGAEELQE